MPTCKICGCYIVAMTLCEHTVDGEYMESIVWVCAKCHRVTVEM